MTVIENIFLNEPDSMESCNSVRARECLHKPSGRVGLFSNYGAHYRYSMNCVNREIKFAIRKSNDTKLYIMFQIYYY